MVMINLLWECVCVCLYTCSGSRQVFSRWVGAAIPVGWFGFCRQVLARAAIFANLFRLSPVLGGTEYSVAAQLDA